MKNKIMIIFFTIIVVISLYLAIHIPEKEGYIVGQEGIASICNSGDDDTNCYNIKYIDQKGNNINVKAKIDPNYYIDSNLMLQKVPYGYIPSYDKTSYIPKTQSGIYEQAIIKQKNQKIQDNIIELNKINSGDYNGKYSSKDKEIEYLKSQLLKVIDDDSSKKVYDSNNYDITYHSDPDINSKDTSTAGVGKMWVKDKNGTLLSIPYTDVKNTTLYYETGSYPFGPSSYVPNYEETTLLSKYSNKLNKDSNVYGTTSEKKGFCESTKSSIYEREQKCNNVNHDMCASTNCCVLLGGEKCVAGNINGPSIKANYSDFLIVNRDYYYYKGKCYGNC